MNMNRQYIAIYLLTIKIVNTYIQILYETYVIDFLDRYIVNRFNADKFINVVYKYPSYDDINDKYPNDKIKKSMIRYLMIYYIQVLSIFMKILI